MPFQKKDEVSQDEKDREEQYEKLMPKIGRDFVSTDDLANILGLIVKAIPGLSLDISNTQAVKIAKEYKKNLDEGKTDPTKYKDLVELEDDEPEEESKDEDNEDE
jgi:hypothetical protein